MPPRLPLQVLLCKLIDTLDNAVPWDAGPPYDLESGEEPQYIPRDFRWVGWVGYAMREAGGGGGRWTYSAAVLPEAL